MDQLIYFVYMPQSNPRGSWQHQGRLLQSTGHFHQTISITGRPGNTGRLQCTCKGWQPFNCARNENPVSYMYHLGRITARCYRITRSLIFNFVIYVPTLVLTSFLYSFIFAFIHVFIFLWKPKRNLSILLRVHTF